MFYFGQLGPDADSFKSYYLLTRNKFIDLGNLLAEPKGHINTPCLPEDKCRDGNAECDSGVCVCGADFFEKNGICSECSFYIVI